MLFAQVEDLRKERNLKVTFLEETKAGAAARVRIESLRWLGISPLEQTSLEIVKKTCCRDSPRIPLVVVVARIFARKMSDSMPGYNAR